MTNSRTIESTQNRPELLTPDEREVCKEIAAGDAPYSQRALALMALDQGVTHAEAGELSGLTTGQVRYWRDKFRQKRLAIFPEDEPDEEGLREPTDTPSKRSRPARAKQVDGAKKKPKADEAGKKAKKAKAKKSKATGTANRKAKKKKGSKKKKGAKNPKAKRGKSPGKASKKPKKKKGSKKKQKRVEAKKTKGGNTSKTKKKK